MTKPAGRWVSLTPHRKLVTDLMYFSQQVPSVAADRPMNLAPLAAARRACAGGASWAVLFSKAFGMLGRDYPALRRSYLKFPWPHLYEHPHSVAALNVERRLADEDVILYCLIRAPENRSIAEMGDIVRRHQEEPVESLRSYQRSVALARVPWPVRRWAWWGALNVFGGLRAHNYGTFGISSVASQGAGLLRLIPVLTTVLHYGMFDEKGCLEVRLTWDHRVLDGAMVARALVDLESILNREIAQELTDRGRAAA